MLKLFATIVYCPGPGTLVEEYEPKAVPLPSSTSVSCTPCSQAPP
jgi:hypothetical protein